MESNIVLENEKLEKQRLAEETTRVNKLNLCDAEQDAQYSCY
jgi:hypothetical protein